MARPLLLQVVRGAVTLSLFWFTVTRPDHS
jgi:hypothetical protein